jgi:hypothetical protein
MAERFLYLPAIGFAGCLVLVIYAVSPSPRVAAAAVALICVAFGVRTYFRNIDWTDNLSLFASAVKASPASFKTHHSLANALATSPDSRMAQLDRAIHEVEQGLAIIDPLPDERNTPIGYDLTGLCYRKKGEMQSSAEQSYYWNQKALAVLLRGRRIDLKLSEEWSRKSRLRGVQANYTWSSLYMQLGLTYLHLSEPRLALKSLEYGRLAHPDAVFFQEIANAHTAMGDRKEAAVTLMEGVIMNPSQVALVTQLVEIYSQIDPQGCALNRVTGGSTLNLNCPLVRGDLCKASRNVVRLDVQMGRRADADATKSRAISNWGCPGPLFQ